MIIFDLDGTLANCEHRRHFVDERLSKQHAYGLIYNPEKRFKPDWKSFYEACDKDTPIEPVIDIFTRCVCTDKVEIWSGRCESVRDKTLLWLDRNLNVNNDEFLLKMRPIGDSMPDDVLKERWLEETYEDTKWGRRTPIQFVFDSDPKSIEMWRAHGIFVFDCNQRPENEF